MFSVLAKSAARMALATMIGATGFGLATTHESHVSADNSTQVEAPQPQAAQLQGEAHGIVDSTARGHVRTSHTPTAGRVAANATATASGDAQAAVDSAPPVSLPTTDPTPVPGPDRAAASGTASIGGSVDLGGSSVNIGGAPVVVGSNFNGSGGLHLSMGS